LVGRVENPPYLKVDGMPVLAIYHLANCLTDFGGIDGAAEVIQVLRDACRDAGFPGIIILCEERYARQVSIDQMKAIGVDHCYAYTWITGNVERQRQMRSAQRDAATGSHLGVIPSVSVGWEPTPWGKGGDGWASVEDYEGLLHWTNVFMPTLPENSLGRKMVSYRIGTNSVRDISSCHPAWPASATWTPFERFSPVAASMWI